MDLKTIQQNTKQLLSKLLVWHRKMCYDLQLKRNIDDYTMFWVFFGFGVATTLFLQWIF
jgi:hypothetical protein